MSDELAAARAKRVKEMQATPLDGQVYKKWIEAGLTWLRANQEMVNALNVFPVPDGDTGTNMVLTMQSAYDETADLGHHKIGDVAAAVSQGALMGARGNSGVILSQIWRGFSRSLEGAEVLTGENFAQAFVEASETAYRGVVRPVEGTILTVSKDIGIAATAALEETQDPIEILEKAIEERSISPSSLRNYSDENLQNDPRFIELQKKAGLPELSII